MNKYIYFVDSTNTIRADLTTAWRHQPVPPHHTEIIEWFASWPAHGEGGTAAILAPGADMRLDFTDRALVALVQGHASMICIHGQYDGGNDFLSKVPVYVILER